MSYNFQRKTAFVISLFFNGDHSRGGNRKLLMSQHSDENQLVAGSDSFWEPYNYKRTTKRIEDGHRLCNDLLALIQDRADIEKAYAKSLKGWSKKWQELIEKGPEYGTTEAAWKGVCVESDRLGDLHLKVRDGLCNDVSSQIKSWQKENYHKSIMQLKERKEMEEQYKKAQKPWMKLLQKVEKAKADYHGCCKAEKSAINQEKNASGDTSISHDQVKKLQERVQKAKDDVSRSKEKYEAALNELNNYNPKYIEEMTVVFEKCQIMERERLEFVKSILFAVHQTLNISEDTLLGQIYQEFHHTITNADYEKDLKWWSNNHGVNMAMNWPQFEEYTEEFRDITKGSRKGESLPAPITLINQRFVNEDAIVEPPVNNKWSIKKSSNNNKLMQEEKKREEVTITKTSPITNGSTNKTGGGQQAASATAADTNPFDENEWDGENDVDGEPLTDNGEPGVPVKALYDYVGAESDELSFKQGDVFEKLEDEDEQGWCKGRKDGRVGLYPANYVEVIH